MKERLTKLIKEAQERYIYAEEQAQYLIDNCVIVTPCKVGDTVYKVWSCGKHGKSVAEFEVTHIDIDDFPDIEVAYCKTNSRSTYRYFFSKAIDFGKTVFLTREEAERALKGGVKE